METNNTPQETIETIELDQETCEAGHRYTPSVPTWILGVLAVLGGNLLIGM